MKEVPKAVLCTRQTWPNSNKKLIQVFHYQPTNSGVQRYRNINRPLFYKKKPERSGVSLLIDIENCIKAQQSAGYERWAKIENLKRAARTMVFLDQHGISHYTDLEQKITVLQDSNEQTAAALKAAERRLSDLALLIKHTATYKELKPLYSEYKKSHDKEKYLRGREREIILFEASARALKAAGVGDKLPDLAKLREEYSRLSEEKNRLYAEYCNCTKE